MYLNKISHSKSVNTGNVGQHPALRGGAGTATACASATALLDRTGALRREYVRALRTPAVFLLHRADRRSRCGAPPLTPLRLGFGWESVHNFYSKKKKKKEEDDAHFS